MHWDEHKGPTLGHGPRRFGSNTVAIQAIIDRIATWTSPSVCCLAAAGGSSEQDEYLGLLESRAERAARTSAAFGSAFESTSAAATVSLEVALDRRSGGDQRSVFSPARVDTIPLDPDDLVLIDEIRELSGEDFSGFDEPIPDKYKAPMDRWNDALGRLYHNEVAAQHQVDDQSVQDRERARAEHAEMCDWQFAWDTALTTMLTILTWHLASKSDSYNFEKRETLVAPWIETYGRPEGMPS